MIGLIVSSRPYPLKLEEPAGTPVPSRDSSCISDAQLQRACLYRKLKLGCSDDQVRPGWRVNE
jgi:hypothetical protein